MAIELKGKPVADALDAATTVQVEMLADRGVVPALAIVQVGTNAADTWYANAAAKRLSRLGMTSELVQLPADVSQDDFEATLAGLSADPSIHGVLVLRPLPSHLDEKRAFLQLDPQKDVDGITVAQMGALYAGDARAFAPCTAEAVIALLNHYGFEFRGAKACVLGRSLVVGKPVAQLLLARDATPSVVHSRTMDAPALASQADLVVSAMGRAEAVDGSWIAPGAWAVDVSTNERADGTMVGDFNATSVAAVAGAMSPVPGGIGAITTAVLANHVAKAALAQLEGDLRRQKTLGTH